VIGLVQVGKQAHADRYMYIPSIGLLVAAVWAGQHLMRRWQHGKPMAIGLTAAGLTACVVLTHNQLKHWDNSVELMTYALAHTPNNAGSQATLGAAFAKAGRAREAIAHYRESLRLEPKGSLARLNLGVELANADQLEEAGQQFVLALEQSPHSEVLLNNLGAARARQGEYRESLVQFREAIRWHPNHPKAYHNAAMALQAMGEAEAAVTNYAAVLRLEPHSPDTLDRLAGLLARCPIAPYHQPEMAVRLAKEATGMTHDQKADYLDTLATAYAAAGQYTNAIAASEKAINIAKGHVMAERLSKLQNDLLAYQAGRNPESDWKQGR
jgi:tetratricopeptide (TPR) repeat protein